MKRIYITSGVSHFLQKIRRRYKRYTDSKYRRTLIHPRFVINVTNMCNLNCFSCSSLCDKPYGNPYRDEPRRQPLEHLDSFARHIKEYKPGSYFRLTGGEPTQVGADYLHTISDILHEHGFPVSLLTNCYDLYRLDPMKFDQIILDDHKPHNVRDLKHGISLLEEKGHDNWEIWDSTRHRDLELQRQVLRKEGKPSRGLQCQAWMNTITLWQDVVYPCCNIYYLPGWDNNPKLPQALRDAGWTVLNPKLVETLEDWRNTIPGEAVKTCLLSCWVGGPQKWEVI